MLPSSAPAGVCSAAAADIRLPASPLPMPSGSGGDATQSRLLWAEDSQRESVSPPRLPHLWSRAHGKGVRSPGQMAAASQEGPLPLGPSVAAPQTHWLPGVWGRRAWCSASFRTRCHTVPAPEMPLPGPSAASPSPCLQLKQDGTGTVEGGTGQPRAGCPPGADRGRVAVGDEVSLLVRGPISRRGGECVRTCWPGKPRASSPTDVFFGSLGGCLGRLHCTPHSITWAHSAFALGQGDAS